VTRPDTLQSRKDSRIQGFCTMNLEVDCSMSPLYFDKESSYTSERVADTVDIMEENWVKQFLTIYKKCYYSGETIKDVVQY